MFGVKEVGVLGASLALAGGVAFLIWTFASRNAGKQKPRDSQPSEKGDGYRIEAEEDKKEPPKEEPGREAVRAVEAERTSTLQPVETGQGRNQILVLGLDGAGKTSLLRCFSGSNSDQDVQPTEGLNAVSISRGDLKVEFLEIGGKQILRQFWQKYVSRALLLVFVVDSSDPQQFPVAKKHLHELASLHPGLPVMILANKQDLPGSCGIVDIHDALALSELGDRRLFLIGTYVRKGEREPSHGVQDAQEMILQVISESR